jgi:hypothetical protein
MGGAPGVPNTSRRLLATTAHEEAFNLRECARRWCPEALDVVVKCLKSQDEKVRLMAATILFERSYGKPELHASVATTHAFIVAPAALSEQDWTAMYASGAAKRPEPATRLLDADAEVPPGRDKSN